MKEYTIEMLKAESNAIKVQKQQELLAEAEDKARRTYFYKPTPLKLHLYNEAKKKRRNW